jgi:hypothetical protein
LINLGGASAPTTTHGRNTMKLHHWIIDTIVLFGIFAIIFFMLAL